MLKPVTYIKLNPKSSFFFDPDTRLKLKQGDLVEYTPEYQKSKRIQYGLNTKHIILETKEIEFTETPSDYNNKTVDGNPPTGDSNPLNGEGNHLNGKKTARNVYDESTADDIMQKFEENFNLDELKAEAKTLGITFKQNVKYIELAGLVIDAIDDIVLSEESEEE